MYAITSKLNHAKWILSIWKKNQLAFICLKITCVLRNFIFVIISFEQIFTLPMSQATFIIAMIYSFFDMWDMFAIFLRNMELAYWGQILIECSLRINSLWEVRNTLFSSYSSQIGKDSRVLHWLQAILGESQLWIQSMSVLRETCPFSHSSTAIQGERKIPIPSITENHVLCQKLLFKLCLVSESHLSLFLFSVDRLICIFNGTSVLYGSCNTEI